MNNMSRLIFKEFSKTSKNLPSISLLLKFPNMSDMVTKSHELNHVITEI